MIKIPKPKKGETRQEFISRFMSSSEAQRDFPDTDQRLAVANSMWRESHKEVIFCKVTGLETKESDDDKIIKGGYISTTHLDQGFYDANRDVWIRDKVAKQTLDAWAEELNEGNPRANKVSINHNREPHVAGVAIKGSAKVDYLGKDDKGEEHYGLYVETLVDKTKENYKDTKFRILNGLLDSFSIEFHTKDPATGEYLDDAVKEETIGEGIIRTLLPNTVLDGYTLASQPMNEHAIMIKEIKNNIQKKESEEITMTEKLENKEEVLDTPKEEPKLEEANKEVKVEEEAPKAEVKEEEEKPKEEEAKPVEDNKEEEVAEESKEVKLDSETKESLVKEFKESLKELKVEEKVQMNTNKDTQEMKEVIEYKEALNSKDLSVSAQFRIAGKLADALNLHYEGKETRAENKEFKNFRTNGTKLEYKNLGLGTNSTTYTQSVAELSDIYDPVINNTLNQKTVLWNILEKDDFSNKGNNQVQFTVKSAANTTAAAYTGNAVAIGNVGRDKNQTKFKKYQVGVGVDGDMIAAARGGPIGDVFSKEVEDSTEDLLSVINQDLFTEKGAETDAECIGLPYITDAEGNPTLYGLTRANFGYMDGNSGATYINANSADISLSLLRQAMRQSVEDAGSNMDDLFFVCDMTQYHKFLAIYDSQQRPVPVSSRLGFEGRASIDGIPIFVDKDSKSGSWFLIDRRYGYRVAMWIPPTLEMLGKDSDSMKGFIKTYFATYSRNPNMLVEIYGAATS